MTIVGNYELVARLATGGMAETHVARSLIDGSVVVIKLLLPRYAGNAEFIEMFVDEGRVISSLQHPNVVSMREFGFHNELPFLAMEYLHGVDLRTLTRTLVLRRKEQVPVDVALYIASAMCAGLHHAHDARTIDGKPMEITHRDVSPQNVVLTFDGAVKLIDFGIATARGRMHETRSGALKGKIPYMAPEQVRAGATDRRTDTYATGVVLYEMLSGRRPYLNRSDKIGEFSLMMAIVNHDVVPLETLQAIPQPLAKVVMKAIASEPTRRYETAEAMRVALEGIAAQLGIELTAARLKQVLGDVFGQRRTVRAVQTSAQVKAIVESIEDARTNVDETHDPSTVDLDSMPLATTGKVPGTEKSPPPFEDALEHESDRSSPIVDKIVEANVTRLRFHRQIEEGFRWNRLFDGIEGIVEVDFGSLGDLTLPSVTAAAEALRGLGSEVSEIRLIAAPIMLAMELEDLVRVVSVSCRGRCPSCDQQTICVLGYDEIRDRIASGSSLPCSRCGTGLVEIELGRRSMTPSIPMPIVGGRSSIKMLVATPITGSMPRQDSGRIQMPDSGRARMPPSVPPPLPVLPMAPRRGAPPVAFWIGSGVVGVIVIAALAFAIGRRGASTAGSGSQPSITPRADEWIVEVDAEGANEHMVASLLELRALRAAVIQIESELPQRIRAFGVQPLERTVLTLDGRPESLFEIQRQSISWTPGPVIKAHARFAMPSAVHVRLRELHSQIKKVGDFELINAPPSRPAGVMILSAPARLAAHVGDRVVTIGGTPVLDLADVTGAPGELTVEHRERKTVAAKER